MHGLELKAPPVVVVFVLAALMWLVHGWYRHLTSCFQRAMSWR